MERHGHRAAPLALLGAAWLFGCGGADPGEPRAITEERIWRPVGLARPAGVATAERFGYGGRSERPAASEPRLAWDTPAGWRELPASSMRIANFLVAGDERAECYLTILGGDGGGLLANVNRWRGQMSLPPIDADGLAELPRAPFFGADAVLVDFKGTFVGMGGEGDAAGYRLVGLLAVDGNGARFLKMVGPADVLAPEVDAFLELAASFRAETTAADPHAGLDVEAAAPHGAGGSALTWTAPEGWRRGPERAMREVTFLLGDSGEAECYVALLAGTGGGAFANVNRWRNQMGRTDLSQDEFDELERVSMLGAEGVLVEVDGTYRGMGDEHIERAGLLGAVCQLPDRAVFVKLIGPAEVVDAAREDFLAFCASLERGG